MKIVSLTSSIKELRELIPLLRDLYYEGQMELLCLVNSSEESGLRANPASHRRLREYSLQSLAQNESLENQALLEAARNALLEERPSLVIWPRSSFLKDALRQTIQQLGLAEFQVGLDPRPPLSETLNKLRVLVRKSRPPVSGKVLARDFLEPHWKRLAPYLKSPCLVQTSPQILQACREKIPHIEFHEHPTLERYPSALSLFGSSFAEKPQQALDLLRKQSEQTLSLEPVNSPIAGALYNFCYGPYDNEFALAAPEIDLREQLGDGHSTEIWDARCGQAGVSALPHPDGKYPAFFTTWPEKKPDWLDRFALPAQTRLRIVFADSGNVAGSVLHHTEAVNRFTDSEAWAVTGEPHPFIGPQNSNERVFFTKNAPPTGALIKVLKEADCVVFFEDDDEDSANWSFPIGDYLKSTPKLHLYIGYRVHSKIPKLTRTGRTILTPLPHLLKMYPGSQFYAGFPPLCLLDVPLREPRSKSDGICRFLHTPSLPHWTTSRYPYHKDTESFVEAARVLKKKYGEKVEFHQVGGWSHAQVIEARLECDVTFNQLRGFHGLSGDEAMLLGRPCVQFFDQFNVNRHLEYWGMETEFPWLSCQRENLVDSFEELFLSAQKRERVGQQSRDFMLKYFSPQKGILPLLYHCYRAVHGGP